LARAKAKLAGAAQPTATYPEKMSTCVVTRTASAVERGGQDLLARVRQAFCWDDWKVKLQPTGTLHISAASPMSKASDRWTEATDADISTLCSEDASSDVAMNPEQEVVPSDLMVLGLLGCWADSIGNLIVVHSDVSSPESALMATISKPSCPDIRLPLREEDGCWYCGRAVLDLSSSGPSFRLAWVFPDGHLMVWLWRSFTMEAVTLRGWGLPEEFVQHAQEKSGSPTASMASMPSPCSGFTPKRSTSTASMPSPLSDITPKSCSSMESMPCPRSDVPPKGTFPTTSMPSLVSDFEQEGRAPAVSTISPGSDHGSPMPLMSWAPHVQWVPVCVFPGAPTSC